MGVAILDFTPVMMDMQTTLTTMDDMAVNHIQVVQAVCAGFPNRVMVTHEIDGLINSVSRGLGMRDIEKIHSCGDVAYGFMLQVIQPYSAPQPMRYGCAGFYHNQGYVLCQPANDPNFISELIRVRQNMVTARVDLDRLHSLTVQSSAIDAQMCQLYGQIKDHYNEEIQQQIDHYQVTFNQLTQEIDRLRSAL